MRRRLALVPAPLTCLLAAVAVVGVAWSLFTPPLHVPDEDAHYAYVQSLADDHHRPLLGELYTAEQDAAEQAARGRRIVERHGLKPAWTDAAERRFDARRGQLASQPRPDRLRSTQADDPPLYYAYAAAAYELTGGSFFDRLFAMRLWSVLLLLVTTTAAWLLAGELFGRDRLLQLVTAGCVGLQPMVTFMSSGLNPDGASFATAAIVLWLTVRILKRGPTPSGLAALAAALLTAALVKAVLLSLAPPAVLAVILAYRRYGSPSPRRSTGRPAAIAITVVGILVFAAVGVVAGRDIGAKVLTLPELHGFASYLWQYYLPRLPFQDPVEGLGTFRAWTWLSGSWGRFGWLEIRYPYKVYGLFGLVSLAAFAGAALAIRRGRMRADWSVIVFFAAAAGSLLFALHIAEYSRLSETGEPFLQGRYLLPLLPVAGLATAAALMNLVPRHRAHGAAAVLGSMLVLQLSALVLVAGRFYV